jgi:hypothetical protein
VGETDVGDGGNCFRARSNWAGFSFDLAPLLRSIVFVGEAPLGLALPKQKRYAPMRWPRSAPESRVSPRPHAARAGK